MAFGPIGVADEGVMPIGVIFSDGVIPPGVMAPIGVIPPGVALGVAAPGVTPPLGVAPGVAPGVSSHLERLLLADGVGVSVIIFSPPAPPLSVLGVSAQP